MYCETCGRKLDDNETECRVCNQTAPPPPPTCPHCGVTVEVGQALCLKCGFMIREAPVASLSPSVEARNAPPHAKYTARVRQINILSLIAQSLALLAIVAIIFFPIYETTVTQKVDPNDLESWKNLEGNWGSVEDMLADEDFMLHGIIKKKVAFSFFEDIPQFFPFIMMQVVPPLFYAADVSVWLTGFLTLLIGVISLFALFAQLIFALICGIWIGKKIYALAFRVAKPEEAASERYRNPAITCFDDNKGVRFYKQRNCITMLAYAAFYFVATRPIAGLMDFSMKILSSLAGTPVEDSYFGELPNIITISGLSLFVILPIVFVIGSVVLGEIAKRKEAKLRKAIEAERQALMN